MNLIEAFTPYIGTREYDGIVAVIQNWFYGKMVKAAWCATSMSYFANKCGILDQLGGKNQGVWEMYNACKVAHKGGTFYDYGFLPEKIPEGAVCFFLRNGASHVTVCADTRTYNPTNYLICLGGNQNDAIQSKAYKMANLQAIFIPDYPTTKKPTIYKGYKDSERGGTYCAQMQTALNQLMGSSLEIDGSCGGLTDAALRAFMASRLTADAAQRHGARLTSCSEQTSSMSTQSRLENTTTPRPRTDTTLSLILAFGSSKKNSARRHFPFLVP